MVTPSDVTPIPGARTPQPPDRHDAPAASHAPDADLPRIVPRRHVGRWPAAAVALLLFATVLVSVVRDPAFRWDVVARCFTTAAVLDGLLLSLWPTAVAMTLGFVFGTPLAATRLSVDPALRTPSWGYVWIFRSTPLLVRLLFWFHIGALYPTPSLGIPLGAQFATVHRIVVPQAMRSIVPTAGNMLNGTLKGTGIVGVPAVPDLPDRLYPVQLIDDRTYQIIPLPLVAALWYIAVTTVLGMGRFHVERYYARPAAGGAR